MIRPIDLSCDVYNGSKYIVNSYKDYKPRIIDKSYFKNNIGSVAFSILDKKNLYITFRGCNNIDEVVNCIDTKVVKAFLNKDIYINSAILKGYEEVKDDIDKLILDYTDTYPVDNIVFSGHSLGGSIAQTACAFTNCNNNKKTFTYGAPYVGNKAFCNELKNNAQYHIRYVVKHDIIPNIKFNTILKHNGRKVELASAKKLFFPYNLYEYHTCMNYRKCLNQKKLIDD